MTGDNEWRSNPFTAPPRRAPKLLLTPQEQVRLARAPRRPGTEVRVKSYDIIEANTGLRLPVRNLTPDHMYVEYDDGRDPYIYRGGPSPHGLHAQVDPVADSPDHGRGDRILFETFLPGINARAAAKPAQAMRDRIERSGRPYLLFDSNSNDAVGDLTQAQFGWRAGDDQTWGWRPDRRPQGR